jgi:hypothetical protein
VKGWIVLSGIALILLTSLPAMSQQSGKRPEQGGPGRPTQQQQVPARDAGWQKREANRDARMTPEQKRQLRRDVHDHGSDIYRDRSGKNRP